ncbi:MAG: transposase [Microbacterium arborescens]
MTRGAHPEGDDAAPAEAGDLDLIAAELLRIEPARFIAARDQRARRADAALARGIRSLRKPTTSAWAVNRLSADPVFREALELAISLRTAQDDLDAVELARLGTQRRALVAALARRAVELAAEVGVALSAAARDDVQRTVNAAIVDPVAGAVVAAGRLLRPLDPGVLDAETLRDRVAGSIPGAESVAVDPPDDLAGRRARREADRRRREAELAHAEAHRAQSRAERQRDAARERADRAHERADGLRRELERAVADAADADAAVDESEQAVGAARDAARATEWALARAADHAERPRDQ